MSKKRWKKKERLGVWSLSDNVVHYIMFVLLALLSIACLYPFLIVVSSSFQSQENLYNYGYRVFAKEYTLDTYKVIFKDAGMLIDSYVVTIITTVLTTLIGVAATASCGYVMSRRDYRYRNILSFYVFFTMLFHGGLVPSYILISKWLGLKDSIWALILPLCVSAWNLLLMKGFFASIPTSLIESTKLDGAGEFRILISIVAPLSKPAIATISLFEILGSWNEYMNSLLYIDNERLVKLQYLLMRIMKNIEFLNTPEAMQYGMATAGMEVPTLGMRMAMCVLAAGPIVIVFPFFQKYFTKGITLGGVKG